MIKNLLYTITIINAILVAFNFTLVILTSKVKIKLFKKKVKSKDIILEEYEMLIVDLAQEYIRNNTIESVESFYNMIAKQLCYELDKENINMVDIDETELLSYIERVIIVNDVFSNKKEIIVEDSLNGIIDELVKTNNTIPKGTVSIANELNDFSKDEYEYK